MLIGVCARDVCSQIALMPLMACSPNLRTHFRHLYDFAVVVILVVFVSYLFVNTVAGVVSGVEVVVHWLEYLLPQIPSRPFQV